MIRIDYNRMRKICLSDIQSFEPLGDVYDTPDGIYIYKENPKAKILAVAHLDTVLSSNHFYHVKIGGDSLILNAQLDDRLGVYTILDILPQLGIEYDLLLTEGEEQGRSTAAYFESGKDYNWMLSFDRRGDDVVMYQYDNDGLRKDMKRAGLRPGHGTFSDIVFLEHLGVCGMNVGTGYEGEHTIMSYANMTTLCSQVKRFKTFYDLFQDKKYPYIKKTTKAGYRFEGFNYPDYDNLYCYLCDSHQGKNQVENDIFLCDACFNDAGQCSECHEIVFSHELIDNVCLDCQEK
jgi:hypothetical protein